MKPLQVVVSSTCLDLDPYRAKAAEVIRSFGMRPMMMEDLTAASSDPEGLAQPIQASLDLVDGASLYVGILAWRYGYTPTGYNRSMTEIEYNRAEELRLDRLVFIIEDSVAAPDAKVDTGPPAAQLAAFKRRLQERNVVKMVTTPDDFAAKLAVALHAWTEKRSGILPAPDSRRLVRLSSVLARDFAQQVAEWLDVRFAALARNAGHPALSGVDVAAIDDVLPAIARDVEQVSDRVDFPGGFYVLDATGLVIGQWSPRVVVNDIRGRFNAKDREYFERCRDTLKPYASNSFTSADRRPNIIVLAVPRFDSAGAFHGVLDAVVDLPDAPFSDLAAEVGSALRRDGETGKILQLLLIDEHDIVLGSMDVGLLGAGLRGHPAIKSLRRTARGRPVPSIASQGYGALVAVTGSVYHVAAFWVDPEEGV